MPLSKFAQSSNAIKLPARAGTTAALAANTATTQTLTANANGALAAQDGVTLIVGDRLLVKNEGAGANNGIYSVTVVGTGSTPWVLTRVSDFNGTTNVTAGVLVVIAEGTTQADTIWELSTDGTVTVGTTALTFIYVGGVNAIDGSGAAGQLAGFTDANTLQGITIGANLALTATTLNAHFQRETMADANTVFSAGKTMVGLTSVLTTTRTLTLPAANAFPAGTALVFVDEIEGITNTNNVTITRAGADTINAATTLAVYVTGATVILITDGTNKWKGGVVASSGNGAWTAWVPTWTGFSANPTAVTARYIVMGKTCICHLTGTAGTSNATTLTVTLPFAAANTSQQVGHVGRARDNSALLAGGGIVATAANSNILSAFTGGGGVWTGSGTKMVEWVGLAYEIA